MKSFPAKGYREQVLQAMGHACECGEARSAALCVRNPGTSLARMRKGRSEYAYWKAVLRDLSFDHQWDLVCWNCMKCAPSVRPEKKT